MAKRSSPAVPVRARLTTEEIRKGIARFQSLLSRFEDFDPDAIQGKNDPAIIELAAASNSALEKTFPAGSWQHRQYSRLGAVEYSMPHYAGRPTPIYEVQSSLRETKATLAVLIRQAIDDLKEDLDDPHADTDDSVAVSPRPERSAFVVHGHDEGFRESVARFLEKLNIQPIILHEQANRGRTLIEKFETHGKVGFAVVLLSPDDIGGKTVDDLKPRARQNVILELGYFIGALGRERVCAMRKGVIEEPSDILGIGYSEFDSAGAWRQKLAQEIEAIGIEIDWNRVMKP